MDNNIQIKRAGDHYEGYLNGEFISSGDTYHECYSEIVKAQNDDGYGDYDLEY